MGYSCPQRVRSGAARPRPQDRCRRAGARRRSGVAHGAVGARSPRRRARAGGLRDRGEPNRGDARSRLRLISGGPRTCVVAGGGANAQGGEQTAAARPSAGRAVDSGDPSHGRRHHRRRRLPRRPRFPLSASARSTSDRRAVPSVGRSLPHRASRHPASAERGRRCSRTGMSVSSPGERCQTSAPTSRWSDMPHSAIAYPGDAPAARSPHRDGAGVGAASGPTEPGRDHSVADLRCRP